MSLETPTPTTVEIVDDHELFANTMGEIVRGLAGYRVVGIANTGERAVEIARATRPDVVLLDFHLPGITADLLMPRIAAVSPASAIVILTSDRSDRTLARGVRAGAVGFLTKDSVLGDLERALHVAARRGIALSDAQLRIAGLLRDAVGPPRPAAAGAPPAGGTPSPADPPDPLGISVVLSPIPSFSRLAHLENELGRLPGVEALYIREFHADVAIFTVHLGPSGSGTELARALAGLLTGAAPVGYRIQGFGGFR